MNIAVPLSLSPRLSAGRVFLIRKSEGIAGLHVETGKIWLTATPGAEDIVLQSGDTFTLAQGWPFVLEALSDARIAFLKALNFQ